VLFAAAPAIWFAGPLGGLALAPFLLVLLSRWIAQLPLAPRLTDKLLAGGAIWTGVTALAVSDWHAGAPKLFGVLLGLALAYAIGTEPSSAPKIQAIWLGLAIGLTGLIALAALFLAEWPQRKLLPLDNVYTLIPAGPRVVDHGGRPGGIGPNQVGGTLALLLPLGLSLALDQGRTGRSIHAAAASVLALAITVLVLTQSRSAVVGATAGLAVVCCWWVQQRAWTRTRRAMVQAASAVALTGTLTIMAYTWLAPLHTTTDTLTGRLLIWTASIVIVGDHLYTGVGPGQFTMALNAAFPQMASSVAPHIPHAHNFVLQALLDLGLPGVAVLSALVFAAAKGLIAAARQSTDRSLRLLAVGLGGSLVSYFVFGLTDTIALGARGGFPFWLVLGLALAAGRLATPAAVAT
jgi:O-antigen ligase